MACGAVNDAAILPLGDKKEIKNMFVFRRKYGIVRPYKNLLTMES